MRSRTLGTKLFLGAATSFAIGLLSLTGCSVIVDTDDVQCATTADCAALGFGKLVCGDKGVCVPLAGCETNKECIDRNNGKAFICRHADRTCQPLEAAGCRPSPGTSPIDIANDNTIWIGMVMPITGQDADFGVSNENAIGLAVKDINFAAQGLPPTAPGQPRRRIAVVGCDEEVDVEAATKHLVDNLKVPVIVGAGGSSTVFKMAPITIPGNTLLISPAASSPLIADLATHDPRLIWLTIVNDGVEAKAAAKYLTRVEASTRTELGLAATEKIKVMTLYRSGGRVLENLFVAAATVNGAKADDKANGDFVKRNQYLDEASATPPEAQYPLAVKAATDFKPHVILVVGGAEGGDQIITEIEKGWDSTLKYKPTYLVSDGVIGTPSLCDGFKLPVDTKRLRGFIGGPNEESEGLKAFNAKYEAEIKDGSEPTAYGAQSYDAAYLAAYGIVAAGSQPITGPNVARALERVVAVAPPVEVVNVGEHDMSKAFAILEAGQSFHLNGSSGPLRFDPKTGETPQDMQMTCVDPTADCSGDYITWPNSGLYLDANTDELAGTESCP